MERKARRHVLCKITFAPQIQHLVHRVLGDFADAGFDGAEVFWHEPALGEQPVFHMVRRIHLHEGADQMAVIVGRDAPDHLFHRLIGQGRRSHAIGKAGVVAADLHDIGVAGDRPERIVSRILCHAERHIRPRPDELLMQLIPIAISFGIDQRVGHVGGKGGGHIYAPIREIKSSILPFGPVGSWSIKELMVHIAQSPIAVSTSAASFSPWSAESGNGVATRSSKCS